MGTFNNREIATAFWLIIFFCWMLSRKEIRNSILQLLKTFFSPKIIIPYLLLLLYSVFIVFVLKYFYLWNISNLKETIYWFVFSGAAISFKTIIDDKTKKPLIRILRELFAFTIVLEFIVNTYVFALPIEILFLPILVFLTGLYTISLYKEEFKKVEQIFGFLLAIIGIFFISYALLQIYLNFKEFGRIETFVDFILPPILTISIIPAIYLLMLYSSYDSLFTYIDCILVDSAKIRQYAKKLLIIHCNFRVERIKKIKKLRVSKIYSTISKEELKKILLNDKSTIQ